MQSGVVEVNRRSEREGGKEGEREVERKGNLSVFTFYYPITSNI